MPVYRTSPGGVPVKVKVGDDGAPEPEPERESVGHGMSDHPYPSQRQHLPEPGRQRSGPKAGAARRA